MATKKSKDRYEKGFNEFYKGFTSGETDGIYLLFGIEDFLIRTSQNYIIDREISEEAKAIDLDVVSEFKDIHSLVESCKMFPLISNKRVVVLKDCKDLLGSKKYNNSKDLDVILSYVEDFNERSVLILAAEEVDKDSKLYKHLKNKGKVYEMNRLKEGELKSFILNRLKNSGLGITHSDLDYLINKTDYLNENSRYRLSELDSDLRKLSDFKGASQVSDDLAEDEGKKLIQVTKSDVDEIFSIYGSDIIYDLIDAVSSGHKNRAFEIIDDLLETKHSIMEMIGKICTQMELLYSFADLKRKTNKGEEEIAKELSISKGRLFYLKGYANKYKPSKLKDLLKSAYLLEFQIKSGLMSDRLALEMFLSQM